MSSATFLPNPLTNLLTNAQDSPLRHTTFALDVGGEENLDAYYAAGALALGVGLSAKPRRKARQETVETPPVWWLKSAGPPICCPNLTVEGMLNANNIPEHPANQVSTFKQESKSHRKLPS